MLAAHLQPGEILEAYTLLYSLVNASDKSVQEQFFHSDQMMSVSAYNLFHWSLQVRSAVLAIKNRMPRPLVLQI